ncbi:MAG: hypothetical protein ACJ8J0_07665 [Longimicrobiaceae bacterium]
MNNNPPPPPPGPGGPWSPPPPPPPPGSGGGPPPPPPPGSGGGPPPPPPPPGYGGGPPPPPPPGYGGGSPPPPPPGYGGPPPGYGAPPGYAGPPPGGPPPAKRNWLPWALGCGCGALILLAVFFFGVIGFLSEKKNGSSRRAVGDTTQVSASDMEGTTLYTASEDGLNDELRPHFVPFSFRYPDGWRVLERGDSVGGKNFVKVETGENGFTAENFTVGYMFAPPGQENDPALIRQLLQQFEQQFSAQFSGFQRVGDDHMEIGGHDATGFRFTSSVQTREHGQVQVFGRVLVVPVSDGKGLSIIMLGTPVGSALRSVDDLGVKGGIPVILRTFRIGDAAASGSDASSGDDASTESTGKPTDKPADAPSSDDEEGLKEIRPVTGDSTF